jgi:hypothetical protein
MTVPDGRTQEVFSSCNTELNKIEAIIKLSPKHALKRVFDVFQQVCGSNTTKPVRGFRLGNPLQ